MHTFFVCFVRLFIKNDEYLLLPSGGTIKKNSVGYKNK